MSTAKGLLEQKLPNAKPVGGFRCGGWMSNDAVLRSLMSIEFAYDCSAVPPAVFSYGYDRKSQGSGKDTYGDKNGITPFILELWGYDAAKQAYAANSLSLKWNIGNAILPTTQPYKIFEGSASLIQMPNNAGLSDYSVAQFMTGCLADLQQLALHHDEPLFLNIGCHQEGGSAYKNPLFKFFDANATVLQKAMANEEIVFTTVADAARVADLYMVD
ncbi:hypothetical protein AY600_00775 [Phormidium willei BDU 130791]|nr:hypothetical protein AY600_00775 [Phormidium willei BDU 130791]